MEFGMPVLIETETIEACTGLCEELGLGFVELNMNLPAYQADRLDIRQLTGLAADRGLYYTIHLDENFNPCDFNPEIADAYTRTALDTIAIAEKLGVPVLNMHLSQGVYFTLPERRVYLFEQYRDDYLRGMTLFRDRCGSAAQAAGVTICVENSDGYTGFQCKAIDLLLEHPAFGLTYDVGHDHAIGGKDRDVILARSARLRHMHLHDAAGKSNHLALGSGEMNISACLDIAREHNCRVVLETKTIDGLRRSVRWLTSRGYITG